MTALNTKTRGTLRLEIARAFEGRRFRSGTVTSAGATTTVDSSLSGDIFAADYFKNRELTVQGKFTTNVTAYATTGTFTHPSQSPTAAAADVWECHTRAAALKADYDDAINEALAFAHKAHFLTPTFIETVAFQKYRREYPLPSGTFNFIHRVEADWRWNYQAKSYSSNWDTEVGILNATARTKVAQSFQIPNDRNPSEVLGDLYLLLVRVGTPASGAYTVTIEADSSGSPSGTALASGTITQAQAQAHSLDPMYFRVTFDKRPVLVVSTTYWWVITRSGAADATNYLAVCNDTDAQYGLGAPKVYSGAAWSALTGDLIFTLRGTTPEWMDLEGSPAGVDRDWTISNDGTTRYLMLTKRGHDKLERHDGSPMRIHGQVAPSTVTADTDTVGLPYDYVKAKAGLLLAQRNPDYWMIQPGSQVVVNGWKDLVQGFEKRMRVQLMAGAQAVDPI